MTNRNLDVPLFWLLITDHGLYTIDIDDPILVSDFALHHLFLHATTFL